MSKPESKNPDTGATKSSVTSGSKANTLVVPGVDEKSRDQIIAELGLSPIARNASTAREFAKGTFGEAAVTEAVGEMRRKADKVLKGNLTGVEETLVAQAVALDSIFNEFARRAGLNMGEYINATDTYMRLALKAQAQCRATLETLAEIKNPQPTAFIRQQNIAANQQVNNGGADLRNSTRAGAHARAENLENQSNELKAVIHDPGQRLDLGAPPAAGAGNTPMEAVGAVNGSENGHR